MHTASKKIRGWEELVRATGCCVTGRTDNVQIHHVVGRKGKHNKVLIGPVYILPLHRDYHLVTGSHPNAWHKNKKGFIKEFGHPRDLWMKIMDKLNWDNMPTDSIDEIQAIMDCPV